ncbi:MAG: hypothetical protein FWC47_16725 [Oscillospiraceae bacterium]|nr:hypothetical protein [Oscillospiraceae bacterium]
MLNPLDLTNIEEIRREGLKALAERLGPVGMVTFIRLYDNGFGDYSIERRENIDDFSESDFLQFVKNNDEK